MRNCNGDHKIAPNTKKNNKNNISPNTDAPNTDVPNAADDDDAYTYSLRNRKNNKNYITPNTDAPNNDASNADDDDAPSPNCLILDTPLKRKIDPKSMLKLFFFNDSY